ERSFFFFSSRRRHTRFSRDWSSDVCSSDLPRIEEVIAREEKLVEFIIDKHPDDFSLELFKKEYDYYSRDLLDEVEPTFVFFLHKIGRASCRERLYNFGVAVWS